MKQKDVFRSVCCQSVNGIECTMKTDAIIQYKVYHRHYTLVGGENKEVKILEEPSGIYYQESKNFYRPPLDGLSKCLKANKHDSGVISLLICASRGRNPENPSDRKAGIDTEQRLEVNWSGTSNALTSVSKDNYIIEPTVLTPKRNDYGKAVRKDYENGNISESRHNMTNLWPKAEPTSNTLTSVQKDNYLIEPNNHKYRIRKLTPLECIRLMDFDDSDYDKIKAIGMSDSQIYKQCGNSIIVACLVGIFRKMYIDTEVSNEQLSFF